MLTHGKHVHAYATLFKRREKAGTHLHTYREDKQDKTEFSQEVESVPLHGITEVLEQNADKEHERHSKRHPENLHFSKENSGEYHEGVEQNRAGERHVSLPKQFDKPIHNVKNPKFNYSLKCPISWG